MNQSCSGVGTRRGHETCAWRRGVRAGPRAREAWASWGAGPLGGAWTWAARANAWRGAAGRVPAGVGGWQRRGLADGRTEEGAWGATGFPGRSSPSCSVSCFSASHRGGLLPLARGDCSGWTLSASNRPSPAARGRPLGRREMGAGRGPGDQTPLPGGSGSGRPGPRKGRRRCPGCSVSPQCNTGTAAAGLPSPGSPPHSRADPPRGRPHCVPSSPRGAGSFAEQGAVHSLLQRVPHSRLSPGAACVRAAVLALDGAVGSHSRCPSRGRPAGFAPSEPGSDGTSREATGAPVRGSWWWPHLLQLPSIRHSWPPSRASQGQDSLGPRSPGGFTPARKAVSRRRGSPLPSGMPKPPAQHPPVSGRLLASVAPSSPAASLGFLSLEPVGLPFSSLPSSWGPRAGQWCRGP